MRKSPQRSRGRGLRQTKSDTSYVETVHSADLRRDRLAGGGNALLGRRHLLLDDSLKPGTVLPARLGGLFVPRTNSTQPASIRYAALKAFQQPVEKWVAPAGRDLEAGNSPRMMVAPARCDPPSAQSVPSSTPADRRWKRGRTGIADDLLPHARPVMLLEAFGTQDARTWGDLHAERSLAPVFVGSDAPDRRLRRRGGRSPVQGEPKTFPQRCI